MALESASTNQPGSQPRAYRMRHGKPPQYHRVTQTLRRRLSEGAWAAGVKLPTLRELADEFKVSTNTIRSAIRILEGEGCLYHVPDVGAFVHPSYPVRLGTRVTIALATIDIGGAFEMGIARGIEQACQDRGWGLQIYDAQADAAIEARNLARLADSETRGAIILPISDHANLETLIKLKLAGYTMVLVDRGMPGLKVDLVESDHEKGAYLATEHLIESGHERILMVTDPPTATSVAARIRGFERALTAHGREPSRSAMIWVDLRQSLRDVQEGHRWLEGCAAALPVLEKVTPPVAIFAHNDYSAWGVSKACQKLGLRVPEDVSIVGFDDSDIMRAISPPITTIGQRMLEIGRKAVELLERRLQPGGADRPPEHVLIDVDFIQRESVRRLV